MQADDSVDEEVLNHYCWMYSTFDIPEDFMVSSTLDSKYKYMWMFPTLDIPEDFLGEGGDGKNAVNEKYHFADQLVLFRVIICQKVPHCNATFFAGSPLNRIARDVHSEF